MIYLYYYLLYLIIHSRLFLKLKYIIVKVPSKAILMDLTVGFKLSTFSRVPEFRFSHGLEQQTWEKQTNSNGGFHLKSRNHQGWGLNPSPASGSRAVVGQSAIQHSLPNDANEMLDEIFHKIFHVFSVSGPETLGYGNGTYLNFPALQLPVFWDADPNLGKPSAFDLCALI